MAALTATPSPAGSPITEPYTQASLDAMDVSDLNAQLQSDRLDAYYKLHQVQDTINNKINPTTTPAPTTASPGA